MQKELSDKIMQLMKQVGDLPVMESRVYKSKDERYVINEIRIKTIKPVTYYEAIVKNKDGDLPYDENAKGGGEYDRSY